MIKTIKVKKQLRLDELLKYILDNDIVGKRYEERMDYDSYSITHAVHVTGGGEVIIEGVYKPDQTFTVEVEEEITEDTELVGFQEVFLDKELRELKVEIHAPLKRKSINDVLEEHYEETECLQIYAKVNGKLQLIWETE